MKVEIQGDQGSSAYKAMLSVVKLSRLLLLFSMPHWLCGPMVLSFVPPLYDFSFFTPPLCALACRRTQKRVPRQRFNIPFYSTVFLSQVTQLPLNLSLQKRETAIIHAWPKIVDGPSQVKPDRSTMENETRFDGLVDSLFFHWQRSFLGMRLLCS